LFLTDGLPTVGERNEAKIATNARQNNKLRTRMINFGVGYDVNSRLLDRLSRDNYGQSEYVRPDESIEAHVSKLYGKMGAPVMTNAAVKIDIEGASEYGGISRVYPKEVYDLFAGEQLVMVGRYKKAGSAKITVTGKVGDKEQKFDFRASFVEKSNDQAFAFVEKLWAMRRIGEIIDELDLKGTNDELIKELVSLSTKHGILTPYTSFLADETGGVRKLADVRFQYESASRSLERLKEAEGVSGFSQRADKVALQQAQLAPAAAAPAFNAGDSFGRAAGGAAGSLARGLNVIRDIDSDKPIVATSVQCAGKETLYKCGNLWVANSAKNLDPDKDAAKIKLVQRFSDEYFKLVAANSQDENAILAAQQEGEELLCLFRGQAYRIK
jgi:Ca-activated chloride channel family protein